MTLTALAAYMKPHQGLWHDGSKIVRTVSYRELLNEVQSSINEGIFTSSTSLGTQFCRRGAEGKISALKALTDLCALLFIPTATGEIFFLRP